MFSNFSLISLTETWLNDSVSNQDFEFNDNIFNLDVTAKVIIMVAFKCMLK